MVTLCVFARDSIDLGKDTLAEAFERERVHAPQYFPIKFLHLQHRVSVHWGNASVTLYRGKPRLCRFWEAG